MSQSNRDLFTVIYDINKKFKYSDDMIEKIEKKTGKKFLSHDIKNFCKILSKKFNGNCKSRMKYFKTKYCGWLNEKIDFSEKQGKFKKYLKHFYLCFVHILCLFFYKTANSERNKKRSGPSKKNFNDLSEPQKRKRTSSLRKVDADEIVYATKKILKSSGQSDASKVLNHVVCTNKNDAKRVKQCCTLSGVSSYTKEEALALYIDAKLSKYQYNIIRDSACNINSNIYPSYYQLQLAKQDCYPPKESITITERYVDIHLQDLANLTIERILKCLPSTENLPPKLNLILKWGCDGASGQSTYKQKFTEG